MLKSCMRAYVRYFVSFYHFISPPVGLTISAYLVTMSLCIDTRYRIIWTYEQDVIDFSNINCTSATLLDLLKFNEFEFSKNPMTFGNPNKSHFVVVSTIFPIANCKLQMFCHVFFFVLQFQFFLGYVCIVCTVGVHFLCHHFPCSLILNLAN